MKAEFFIESDRQGKIIAYIGLQRFDYILKQLAWSKRGNNWCHGAQLRSPFRVKNFDLLRISPHVVGREKGLRLSQNLEQFFFRSFRQSRYSQMRAAQFSADSLTSN